MYSKLMSVTWVLNYYPICITELADLDLPLPASVNLSEGKGLKLQAKLVEMPQQPKI